ncbi:MULTISPECIES: GNAT family N-acetyltransferase [Bacillaceae]|uniref:GNAT family N-acetyltransferase n=1 Tax=Evansella alkalicola TaxID=745819 RepID=A0ABS6JSV0_9BACI|nr:MULTISPECIES: GNAT family N-acetyltransferase [Bacillaceae]MBU9720779.1 GNAT family N-acetyltransferase [Bacillus alkalicola]
MGIRKIKVQDAEAFLSLNKQLDNETSFMLFEPGERQTTVKQQETMIKKIRGKENSEIFVVELDKTDLENTQPNLIGFLAFFGGQLNRNRHSGYLVIGVLEEFRGRGYGKRLFQTLEHWALEKEIHRVELTVMKHNVNALNLYLNMGFEIEGVKRNSLKVNGVYVDEYYLSKLLSS